MKRIKEYITEKLIINNTIQSTILEDEYNKISDYLNNIGVLYYTYRNLMCYKFNSDYYNKIKNFYKHCLSLSKAKFNAEIISNTHYDTKKYAIEALLVENEISFNIYIYDITKKYQDPTYMIYFDNHKQIKMQYNHPLKKLEVDDDKDLKNIVISFLNYIDKNY